MNSSLFSVLIANHNDGKYIECTLNSILNQTYSNWEVIIVDDASDDNSKEIYSKYQNDHRFHIFYNESQKGCGYTKRKCVEMANGEICGFVDADDAITSNALELMVSKHTELPNASLIYSTYYICDKNLNTVSISETQVALPEGTSFLQYRNGAISHFATFKKDAYNSTEGMNPNLLLAEDMDLYFKLEEVGDLFFIPEALYLRRENTGENVSLGKDNTIKARIYDLQATAAACQRRGIDYYPLAKKILEDITTPYIKDAQKKIMGTKQYRFGQLILNPFVKIKHLLKS